jgi:D-alanyl-D-alanine carboxypeptidase (penicillin-binding protein 5/6)
MKKTACLLTVLVVFSLIPPARAYAVTFSPPFTVSSEAAVLINLDKNITVYEKNPAKKMYPASLTKLMTAMVVLDNIKDLDNTRIEVPAVVTEELRGMGASNVGLSQGEVTTAADLMYSMLLFSACESAGTLAYSVGGGSIPNFINMMNEKAREIGCTGTNFVNAHGLYDDKQYTNARDMAQIAKYAVNNYPKLVEIACTAEYSMKATNYNAHGEDGWLVIRHTNRMLSKNSEYYHPYVRGLKTGTLDESGRCLASLASRDGNNYLLVTMNSPMRDDDGEEVFLHYEDHKNIYEWAFDNFVYQKLVSVTEEITELPVKLGHDKNHVLLVPAEDYSTLWYLALDPTSLKKDIDTELYTDQDGEVTAPVTKGEKFGTLTLSLSGEIICIVDLVAMEDVERSQLEYSILKARQFTDSFWFKLAVGIAVSLIVLYVALFVAVSRKRKRKIKKVAKNRKF